MIRTILATLVLMATALSCKETAENKQAVTETTVDLQAKITTLNNSLTDAAMSQDFSKVSDLYLADALLLAEYNPLIDGKERIEKYYTEIFQRQSVESYQKETTELFDFGETILEIGDFKKTLNNAPNQEGKYFNVWKLKETGDLHLKSETFGYYHPIDSPATLKVNFTENETASFISKKPSLELDAYNALNENCVRDRDTKKLLTTYTDDAIYYPFANTKKAGMEVLTEHFTAYHAPPVKIDSIEIETYDYIPVSDGIISYGQFMVQWTVPGFSGSTQGTGLLYFKRQPDNSLKIHRQIGLHIHNE